MRAWTDQIERWLAGAPASAPVVVLATGDDTGAGGRFSVLGQVERVVRGEMPRELAQREVGCAAADAGSADDDLPFRGGWIGVLEYEHGASLDGALRGRWNPDGQARAWWVRVSRALVVDHTAGVAHEVRDGRVVGAGAWRAADPARVGVGVGARGFSCGALESDTGRARFEQSVARALAHIGAGDAYQVNLAHQLHGAFAGSARALFGALLRASRAWYGAYAELDGCVVCSASPELFLQVEPESGTGAGALIRTRPMKGTRAGVGASQERELRASEKERAELTMIVDLMRNDLGRVCRAGSVRVSRAREVERHGAGTILQATATVEGRACAGATWGALLGAVLPPGSVTGAPKVRASRIIGELEASARGVYCGSIGMISDCGRSAWSVAIRTATITGARAPGSCGEFLPGARLRYGVGAGIVSDSDARAEWEETLAKAGVLLRALGLDEQHWSVP